MMFIELLETLEEKATGKSYGTRFTKGIDGGLHLCDGKRPFEWRPVDECDRCGAQFHDFSDVVYDEVNNKIYCTTCDA